MPWLLLDNIEMAHVGTIDIDLGLDAEALQGGEYAVQRADGAELALRFNELVAVRAQMPEGGINTVEIAVCSVPALLAMKGFALQKRYKQKDAYDTYYCVHNYPGGIETRLKKTEQNGKNGILSLGGAKGRRYPFRCHITEASDPS